MSVEEISNASRISEAMRRLGKASRTDATFRLYNEDELKRGYSYGREVGSDSERLIKENLVATGEQSIFEVGVKTPVSDQLIPIIDILKPYLLRHMETITDRTKGETHFQGLARHFGVSEDAATAAVAYGLRHEGAFQAFYEVERASQAPTDFLLTPPESQ